VGFILVAAVDLFDLVDLVVHHSLEYGLGLLVWSNCILVVDKAKEVLVGDYKVFGDLTLDCFVVDLLSF
jgi:hypothetical protein